MELPRGRTDQTKVLTALFAAILMLLAMPFTMLQSNGQQATSVLSGAGSLVEATDSVGTFISSPTPDSFGEPILLNQTITWHTDGTTTLADDLGRSFSFGIDQSDGSFKLLHNNGVVVQRVTGNGLSYDITWTPIVNENGDVEKYKFTIIGQSDNAKKLRLPIITDSKKLGIYGNRILATTNELSTNGTAAGPDGIGIDWSDAISSGYKMNFNAATRAIEVDVGRSFNIDPTTVDTISVALSPGTTDYYEGEKRVVNVLGTVYAFYYDSANIVYKYSLNGGNTWSSPITSGSGLLNGDSYRWTVVSTLVGSTNYITLLYYKQNGANTDFYAKRATSSGGGLTWVSATLLFSVANNSGCGTGNVCAAAAGSKATNGNIFAAFRYLPSGASSYKYQIRVSTDGGQTWPINNPGTLSEQNSADSNRIEMALTDLASGKMLFVYAKYTTTELTYRVWSGTSWGGELTTSGAGMTANTVKQISADSGPANTAFVAYLVAAPPSTIKVAKWNSGGSFSIFETPPSGSLTHALPSISNDLSGTIVHIYSIASGKVYETRKVAGSWQSPQTNFGTTFTSPNQLTSGFTRAAGLWLEGTSAPWTIKFDQLTLSVDPGFGCGYRNWGVGNWQDNNPPLPIFGKHTDCVTVLSTLAGRSNYVQMYASNGAGVTESYEDAQQGCSPWLTCDTAETGVNIRNALQSNTNFPIKTDPLCNTSCNLPADLEYRMQNQFLWITDGVSKPISTGAHGYVLTNIWFVDKNTPKTPAGSWKNVLVMDLPNTILYNNAGTWDDEAGHAIGSHDSSPYWGPNSNDCDQRIFHISTVIGSSSLSGTWYDTGNVALYNYIKEAFDTPFPPSTTPGCPAPPPGSITPSSLNPQSTWKFFDIEQGVSVQGSTSGNTLEAAYSMGRLSYN